MKTPALPPPSHHGHPKSAARARRLVSGLFALLAVTGGVCSEAGDPVPLAALKKMSVEELMNLEVMSVSRQPEKLLDAASAIQLITGSHIRRSGATTIPEALRLANNLQVAQKTSHGWGISARGFNTELANKLLVRFDGRTVYTPLFSGVFWNAQDYLLEDLDRIEVISGPGGALWGANAVNGVINIISRKASETQGWYLEAGGGNVLKNFAGARYGGALSPKVHYRVYGRRFVRDELTFANGKPAVDSWEMNQGGFRLDAEPWAPTTLTLQGNLYSGHADVPPGGNGDYSGENILGRWSQVFSGDSDLSLQVYYDRTHLYTPITNEFGPTSILTDELDTYDVDFQHRFPLNRQHRIVWGVGYRFTHNTVMSAQTLAIVPARLDQKLFSSFVQDEVLLGENLTLTLGTKLEHNSYTGRELEPSARLQWKFSPEKLLWGAVSRAVRTPSRIDRDAFQPRPSFAILGGNPNFQSENVIAYEAGYRGALASRGTVSVAGFYNVYDRLRSLSFTPATIIPLFFENNVEGETYGVELSATYDLLENWRIRGGYTWLKERLRIKAGKGDLGNALNETSDPEHQLSLRSSVDLSESVEFDAGLRWVDTLVNNNNGVPGTVPSYLELDVRVAWRPTPRLELSIAGQNLLHSRHPEFGLTGPLREEIKRSVHGKISWRY
ncbi:MAG TPA: TonB-dependent receptor [Opitutaceae bacterium]|nr:TonB-dependent receptor [Opitutaceae bacterium]